VSVGEEILASLRPFGDVWRDAYATGLTSFEELTELIGTNWQSTLQLSTLVLLGVGSISLVLAVALRMLIDQGNAAVAHNLRTRPPPQPAASARRFSPPPQPAPPRRTPLYEPLYEPLCAPPSDAPLIAPSD